MRHQRPSGYFGPPPMTCACCGAKEQQSGCVRGFPCHCLSKILAGEKCKRCARCLEHCQCPEKTEQVKDLIVDALYNDSAHHKQWYLWKIAEVLGLDLSDHWDEEYLEPERGIAP